MEINFKKPVDISSLTGGALILFQADKAALEGEALKVNDLLQGGLEKAAQVSRFTGGFGSSLEILAPSGLDFDRIVLFGLGKLSDLNALAQTKLGATITAKLLTSGSKTAHILADFEGAETAYLAEGLLMRAYRFDKYLTKEEESKKPTLKAADFYTATDASDKNVFEGRAAVVAGANMTRDLVSEVPNVLYPESFAAQVETLSKLGVEVTVLGEAEMEKLGMGALLGVGQGSRRESKLAVMRWNGGGDAAPLAFVGKGVTFDTGGISLKPGEGMDMMKWDMGGAGIVTGLMKALAGRKATANVVGVIGLVENMPDGNAQRPGDVVTSMSGQTIEVLNTDAEGRLVLADALWYTKEEFKPEMIIDLATLTGAMIISLGHEYAGYFTGSDEISSLLDRAGEASGEKVWRLPLHENYDKLINSPVADMKNIGGRGAGSITAAQFLQRFTGDVPWAHIDVAGVVWADKDGPFYSKGATGYGVRLLDQFVALKTEG